MATIEDLRAAVAGHWSAMEHPDANRGVAWESYERTKQIALELGDPQVAKFLGGDNYAIVDTTSSNFGTQGLPVIMFLSRKYGFPIDPRYGRIKAAQMAHQKEIQAQAAESAKR